MIIDTHAHILDRSFDSDRDAVILAARKENVLIIESALTPTEWAAAYEISKKHGNFFYTAGFHPHDAKKVTDEGMAELMDFCKNKNALAVGETGLDYHYKNSPVEVQKEVFARHINLALSLGKPLVVHCRDAYADCLALLSSYSKNYRGVVHCFSGRWEDAIAFLEMGFFLGIDGPVTYPNAEKLRAIVRDVPLGKIMVETDAPYLTPQKFRGKRNEPGYVRYIIEEIARIKNLSFDETAAATTANARALFEI